MFCRLVVIGRCILIDFYRYSDQGKGTLIAKTSVFTEQDDRCGNSSTQSQAPEDGYINVRNMLSA